MAMEDYYILNEGNYILSSVVPPPGDRGLWMRGSGLSGEIVPPEPEFKEMMNNTIVPLHRITQNQGSGIWT